MVGCTFGVRTYVAYIYLGIFLATFEVYGSIIFDRKKNNDLKVFEKL